MTLYVASVYGTIYKTYLQITKSNEVFATENQPDEKQCTKNLIKMTGSSILISHRTKKHWQSADLVQEVSTKKAGSS